MKRKRYLPLFCCLFFPLLLWLAPLAEAAGTEWESGLLEKSGAGDLYEELDDETKGLLGQAGVDSVEGAVNADGVFETLSGVLREKLSAPVKALAAIAAVIILCRLASCLGAGEAEETASFAGALACAAVVAVPLLEVMKVTQRAVESASMFLLASIPVYGALMTVSGTPAAGTSYSFLTLAAGNAIPILCTSVIFPLLHMFLALALASSVSKARMDHLANSLYNFSKWLIVLAVTVFSGVLSVQTALNARVDAAANKAAKLVASSAIPIVGGAFGDAVAAIQNSVQIVKSGAGAFGILAALFIFAPPAIEALLWSGVCFAGQLMGDLFEAPKLSTFFRMCSSVAKMILAVVAATCAVSVVSAAIVLFVKGEV